MRVEHRQRAGGESEVRYIAFPLPITPAFAICYLRCSPRMVAESSAHVNAELKAKRCQPSLECTGDPRRDAGGMPVHAHHGAKGLKPERIGHTIRTAPVCMGYATDWLSIRL